MRTTIVSCLLAVSLGACAGHPCVVNSPTPEQAVNVAGDGKASAAPDIARSSVGVEVRSVSADQATADATTRMNAVVLAVKQAGIADKDLRTHSLSIAFEQEPTPPPASPVVAAPAAAHGGHAAAPPAATPVPAPPALAPAATPRGFYRVTNMLEVTIRDLSAVGRVLKAATDAGANSVWGVSFELEDTQPLVAQAREQAVARAKHAAEELSRLTGVKLGHVLSVSEGEPTGGNTGYSGGGPMVAMRAATAEADLPIEHGEITLNYSVQLVYSIER